MDRTEVYPRTRTTRRKAGNIVEVLGWKFRVVKAGMAEAMYVSEGTFETAERAAEVAEKFNQLCYRGGYPVKVRQA